MQKYLALLKIVEVGSYTKAAALLGYSQSALSQMIASLEDELSITLLSRSRYGIRLTPEGERLLPYIQRSVLQYEAMRRAVDEVRGLETGIVRIGTVSSVSSQWLPPVIKRFWERYPNVQMVLHQGDYSSICEWVRMGEVDFGFVNPASVRGLEIQILRTDEFCVVLPVDHPLAEQETVQLQDLAQEPYLLLEEGAFSEPMEAFQKAGIRPDVRLTVHDDYSILAMVEQGLGYSILARMILDRTNYQVAVRSIEPTITRTMALVMKDHNQLPLAARIFLEYLAEIWQAHNIRIWQHMDRK